MHAHQHGLWRSDVAFDKGQVRALLNLALIGIDSEVAKGGRQMGLGHAFHRHLSALKAVADDVVDRGYLDVKLFGKFFQVRHAGHGAVFLHDLADDGCGLQAGKLGKIHGSFCLAGALKHAAGTGCQREDMAGGHQVLGPCVVGHGSQDGGCPVSSADTGSHTVARLDGDGKVGVVHGVVALRHGSELQLFAQLGRHGQADQSAAVMGHEVDGLRRDELGGHGQIAFIFPILVIHEDDHFPSLDIGNGFLNCAQRHMATP